MLLLHRLCGDPPPLPPPPDPPLTHLQGSCREAGVGVGAAQVARQRPGPLHRGAPGQDLSDRRPLARLELERVPVGMHVSSVGVYEATLRDHVAVPVGHGLDRPVGAVQVHGDAHVGHAGRHKVRRVGLALGRVKGEGGGRRREGRVLHRDVEGLVLAPQAQASALRRGRRRLEADRPPGQDHVVSLPAPSAAPAPSAPTAPAAGAPVLRGVGGGGWPSPAQAALGAQVDGGAAALLALLSLLVHVHLLLQRRLAQLVEAAEGRDLVGGESLRFNEQLLLCGDVSA